MYRLLLLAKRRTERNDRDFLARSSFPHFQANRTRLAESILAGAVFLEGMSLG